MKYQICSYLPLIKKECTNTYIFSILWKLLLSKIYQVQKLAIKSALSDLSRVSFENELNKNKKYKNSTNSKWKDSPQPKIKKYIFDNMKNSSLHKIMS